MLKNIVFILIFMASLVPSSIHAETPQRLLDIPKLNYQYPVPVVEIPFVNKQWNVAGLGDYIGWLEDTQWVQGNTVLVAHDYSYPFKNLEEKIALGDLIILYDGNVVYNYYVTEIYKVVPSDVTPTAWSDENILTLLTCSDNETTRLVVRAKL